MHLTRMSLMENTTLLVEDNSINPMVVRTLSLIIHHTLRRRL